VVSACHNCHSQAPLVCFTQRISTPHRFVIGTSPPGGTEGHLVRHVPSNIVGVAPPAAQIRVLFVFGLGFKCSLGWCAPSPQSSPQARVFVICKLATGRCSPDSMHSLATWVRLVLIRRTRIPISFWVVVRSRSVLFWRWCVYLFEFDGLLIPPSFNVVHDGL
jgi:hypothetical protein